LILPLIAAQLSAHPERYSVGISPGHSGVRWSEANCSGKRSHAQQLAVFKQDVKRPRLSLWDRLFWIGMMMLWKDWGSALMIVRPETVMEWQRKRFKRYWSKLSQRKGPGRPPVSSEIRKLVRTMAAANVIWGAPRIHGELLKLGFKISERTVARLMPKRDEKPSQTWKTFLHNQVGQLVAVDFFTVATIQLRVLYVFVVLAHDRRRVLHFNVTEHLTAVWAAQQIVEAFPEASAPRYLLRDRDGIYGRAFTVRVEGMGIAQVRTAARSPWQNRQGTTGRGSTHRSRIART
jgi:putative transposase